MRFLHPAGRGGAFPGSLGGQLFAGGFPTSGLTRGLLGSGHFLLPRMQSGFEAARSSRPAPREVATGAVGSARPRALPPLRPTLRRQMAEGRRHRLLPLP